MKLCGASIESAGDWEREGEVPFLDFTSVSQQEAVSEVSPLLFIKV